MIFFSFHVGDWAKSTMHLSHEERGIYLSLLVRYYDTEQPLPADKAAIYRLLCVRNADAMLGVDAVLDEFFDLQDDGYHNKRADEEIERYNEKSAKASKSAKARWSDKTTACNDSAMESEGNAKAMRTHSEGNANHNPLSINHKPPKSPKGDWPGFAGFWSAYPRKIAKPSALKAWNKIKPDQQTTDRIMSAVRVQSASEQWMKDGGQFIPHPATWLNGQRWDDEMEAGQQQITAPHLREFK